MGGGQAHWRRRLRGNLPRQFIQPFPVRVECCYLVVGLCLYMHVWPEFFATPKLAYLTAHLDKTRSIKILEEEAITLVRYRQTP